jgi:hypothetical protein
MAKRNRNSTQKSIDKRVKAGRGAGRLSNYTPWLHIQDVASRGLVTRIKGWKTGRVHHLLSLLELRYFYVLEWSQDVIDIREQYPLLPLEETLAIAQACGIRHPTDPHTKCPVVMTTDFINTVRRAGSDIDHARTVKYEKDLLSKRMLEKLEIERRYWEERGVDWKIVTEGEISTVLAKNVEWFHQYRNLEDFSTIPPLEVEQITSVLSQNLETHNSSLRSITLHTDAHLGLEPGTSLSLVRHLLACRRWRVDMAKPINACQPLIMPDGFQRGSCQ